jgi:hypothetical protein
MSLFIPLDGRIPSQNPFPSPITGGGVLEYVWPGNNTAGNTYYVTDEQLAAFASAYPNLNTEIITAGATVISPYLVQTTDTRILFNKTLSSPSYAMFPLAASMQYEQPVLIKDYNGDAASNNITISFTNGELCDGLSQVIINDAYGWVTINPYPSGGGGWYLT